MTHFVLSKAAGVALVVSLALGAVASTAQAQTKIVVRTDFKFNGYISPLALAVEKGFYKQAGVDVSIQQGQGSATTVQTVASGVDTFGLADSAVAMLGISAQNVPIKVVSVYNQTGTMGLIYHSDSNWNRDLKALKGNVVISSAGSADAKMLEPALASVGMKVDDVQLQLVAVNARVPLFLRTPGSFLTGFETGDYLRVRSQMPNAKYVPYTKYGVIAYGIGLIARDEIIEKDPDLVKKFVTATRQGWEAAAKDPEAAVAASLRLYPDLSPDLLRQGLKITLEEQLHTPATEGHPIGWTDEGDWTRMVQMLKKFGGLSPKPLSDYYTNQFIVH